MIDTDIEVLQGSGVTPLKCGEIYDMDFVTNFMENTTVKKFENRSAFIRYDTIRLSIIITVH